MKRVLFFMAMAAFAATGIATGANSAEAAPKCKARTAAKGQGQGILGAGTMNAKVAAIAAFESAAAKAHGSKFGKFDKAKGAKFDCRSGTLKATCVVTARPCK